MQVSYLVLDEADKLLAMGFTEQVDALLAAANSPHLVRAFFSATLPEKVRPQPGLGPAADVSVALGKCNSVELAANRSSCVDSVNSSTK